MRTLLLSLLLLISYESVAVRNVQSNIHQLCKQDPTACLEKIPAYIESTPQYSNAWYKFKSHQFSSLFALAKFPELLTATKVIVDNQEAPKEFQFLTHIFYAKSQFAIGDGNIGQQYLEKTKVLFDSLYPNISNPMYLIDYGNILVVEANRLKHNFAPKEKYLAKYKEAKVTLLKVRDRFFHYNNANFQLDLYTNLGHCSSNIDKNFRTIQFYDKARFWAEQTRNEQQIGVANYNLANSYYLTGQLNKSVEYFLKAKDNFTLARDFAGVHDSSLKSIEVYNELGDKDNVRNLIDELQSALDNDQLSIFQAKWFLKLAKQSF